MLLIGTLEHVFACAHYIQFFEIVQDGIYIGRTVPSIKPMQLSSAAPLL